MGWKDPDYDKKNGEKHQQVHGNLVGITRSLGIFLNRLEQDPDDEDVQRAVRMSRKYLDAAGWTHRALHDNDNR